MEYKPADLKRNRRGGPLAPRGNSEETRSIMMMEDEGRSGIIESVRIALSVSPSNRRKFDGMSFAFGLLIGSFLLLSRSEIFLFDTWGGGKKSPSRSTFLTERGGGGGGGTLPDGGRGKVTTENFQSPLRAKKISGERSKSSTGTDASVHSELHKSTEKSAGTGVSAIERWKQDRDATDEEEKSNNGSSLGESASDSLIHQESGIAVGQHSDISMQSTDSPKESTVSGTLEACNSVEPSIVWLATYPNSGTSYTMTLVQGNTANYSIASNYGDSNNDDHVDVPIFSDQPEGPFFGGKSRGLHNQRQKLSDSYVLTKTHCGNGCTHCPVDTMNRNMDEFLEACSMTLSKPPGTKDFARSHYTSLRRVSKVLRLIRNPLDNIVANFHLSRNVMVRRDPDLDLSWMPVNATGFRRWCEDMEQSRSDDDHHSDIEKYLAGVPCRGEVYRYLQWHNRATEMIPALEKKQQQEQQQLQQERHTAGDDASTLSDLSCLVAKKVESLDIHYEAYMSDYASTVDQIFSFIEYPYHLERLVVFQNHSGYDDHFTDQERNLIKVYLQEKAHKDVWKLLERYF